MDIIIKEQRRRRALMIEAKWPGKKGSSLEKECADALKQIEDEQYKVCPSIIDKIIKRGIRS